MKTLKMELGERSYNITVGRDLLAHADEYFKLDRKVFILTDEGVESTYIIPENEMIVFDQPFKLEAKRKNTVSVAVK